MKIESRNLYIPFDEVEEGQCFYCGYAEYYDNEGKTLFMKTPTYHISSSKTFNHDMDSNCIDLETGFPSYMTPSEKVIVCNAKVVVGG